MLLGYAMIVLVPVVCIAWIVWSYRKKAAARATARHERLAQVFGAMSKASADPAPASGTARAPAPQAQPVPAAASPPPLYAGKPQLLDGPHARLYDALRSGLREHAIFAHVSLAALLEVPPSVQGRAREQRQRVLAQYTADCVVCGADMRVIAVVDVDSALDAELRFKSECLKAAGMRHVRVDPTRLAGDTDLRTLILG